MKPKIINKVSQLKKKVINKVSHQNRQINKLKIDK